jgi:hypothetical protein
MALPLILAGPILRRVDPRSVSVWVALREPSTVRLYLWQGRQKSAAVGKVQSGDAVLIIGKARTIRIGDKLHVALVTTALDEDPSDNTAFKQVFPALQAGGIYSYDISVKPAAGAEICLRELGLLDDHPPGAIDGVSADAPRHLQLGYEKDSLPSFVMSPMSLEDIRIAHANCRKAHGPGTDALSWMDDLIEDSLLIPGQRPQQLFLSGDQIYADDVPTCLLPTIHELSVELMGGTEGLPTTDTNEVTVTLSTAPPLRRSRLVRFHGGFTSVAARNHLLTFGEYVATYLLAWSPRVWRALGTEAVCYSGASDSSPFELTNLGELYVPDGVPFPSGQALVNLVKDKDTPSFKAERQRVIVFASTVAKVARVLANTPTYMIFDDHEVSDDWMVNASWRNRVFSRPLGRCVVRNALLAYTFMQAVGSDWESFTPGHWFGEAHRPRTPNMKLLDAGKEYLATRTNRPANKAAEIDKLIGLSPSNERASFHYEASGSHYQVRVMDTRTRRTFRYPTGVAPSFLLGHDAQSSLNEQLPPGPRRSGTKFVLVVAPTPVIGPEIFERMFLPGIMQTIDTMRAFSGDDSDFDPAFDTRSGFTRLGDKPKSDAAWAQARTRGAMFIDAETWPANEVAQHEMLNRLATYERVVVLGGDVHYATTLEMDWSTYDRQNPGAPLKVARIAQLTASAARNALEPRVEALYVGYHWLNHWMTGSVIDGFAWRDGAKLSLPPGTEISLLRHSRMKEKPAILPAYGWPEGTKIEPGSEPDWGWQIKTARDVRTDAERGGPFAEAAAEIDPLLTEAAQVPRGFDRAKLATKIHQQALALQFIPMREAVLTNNCAVISFAEPATGLEVIHTLYSSDRLGYPEDEVDAAAVAARPLGSTVDISSGRPNTVVRVRLVPMSLSMPSPRDRPR